MEWSLVSSLGTKVALARVEQLSPFPFDLVIKDFQIYPNLKSVVWAQEEPMNQGAWFYTSKRIESSLRHLGSPNGIERPIYVGRDVSATTAVGDKGLHDKELAQLLADAFNLESRENSYLAKYLSRRVQAEQQKQQQKQQRKQQQRKKEQLEQEEAAASRLVTALAGPRRLLLHFCQWQQQQQKRSGMHTARGCIYSAGARNMRTEHISARSCKVLVRREVLRLDDSSSGRKVDLVLLLPLFLPPLLLLRRGLPVFVRLKPRSRHQHHQQQSPTIIVIIHIDSSSSSSSAVIRISISSSRSITGSGTSSVSNRVSSGGRGDAWPVESRATWGERVAAETARRFLKFLSCAQMLPAC
ncbi:hypothetical protein Emag_001741 [Eimeria magna]